MDEKESIFDHTMLGSNDELHGLATIAAECCSLNTISATGKFQYGDTLRHGWIRLLHLQPGTKSQPLICSLSISPLQSPSEPFEAVSYVWGEPSHPHTITCNWRVAYNNDHNSPILEYPSQVWSNMTVTSNLHELLLRLRGTEATRVLWIDQICINQQNLTEKSIQLKSMSKVYRAASNVLIWLGEEDADTASAYGVMDWMKETKAMTDQELGIYIVMLLGIDDFSIIDPDISEHRIAELSARKALLVNHVRPQFIPSRGDSLGPDKVQMSLEGSDGLSNFLLKRPWFKRTWTFQEVVSATKATVICGSYQRDWETLYDACQSLLSRIIHRLKESGTDSSAHLAKSVVLRGSMKHLDNFEDFLAQRRLKALLPTIRSTEATDSRDKVLSLMGIVYEDNNSMVFPDYRHPVANLYIAVVKYWIADIALDLSFLSHVQASDPKLGLPSWVPDWSCKAVAAPLIDISSFQAAGEYVASAVMDDLDLLDHNILKGVTPRLVVEGLRIMKVEAVDPNQRCYERHAEMISPFGNPYPTTLLSYPEAYRKAVEPSIPEDLLQPDRASDLPGFWEYIRGKEPWLEKKRARKYTLQELEAQMPESGLKIQQTADQYTKEPGLGRSFFVSNTGFMG